MPDIQSPQIAYTRPPIMIKPLMIPVIHKIDFKIDFIFTSSNQIARLMPSQAPDSVSRACATRRLTQQLLPAVC